METCPLTYQIPGLQLNYTAVHMEPTEGGDTSPLTYQTPGLQPYYTVVHLEPTKGGDMSHAWS